jgi:hypothetical protein
MKMRELTRRKLTGDARADTVAAVSGSRGRASKQTLRNLWDDATHRLALFLLLALGVGSIGVAA